MPADAMTRESESARRPRKWSLWGGRTLSVLVVLLMLMSAMLKLSRSPQVLEQFVGTFGYTGSSIPLIASLEIACAILYAIPRTAVLGAVLLTGYLGGAVATHVRIGDPGFVSPLLIGVAAWAGLYLRDGRLRALMPILTQRT